MPPRLSVIANSRHKKRRVAQPPSTLHAKRIKGGPNLTSGHLDCNTGHTNSQGGIYNETAKMGFNRSNHFQRIYKNRNIPNKKGCTYSTQPIYLTSLHHNHAKLLRLLYERVQIGGRNMKRTVKTSRGASYLEKIFRTMVQRSG